MQYIIFAKLNDMIKIWTASKTNIGDMITPYLLKWIGVDSKVSLNPELIGIGSILGFDNLKGKKCKVWGSGLLNEADTPFNINPNLYFAVRGQLTAWKLKLDNITLGDPGLLVSKYYTPKVNKRFKYGIVTHCTDYKYIKKLAGNDFPYPIINADIGTNSEQAIKDFLDKLNECEFIFSSSLHGLIFAHAYGIPAIQFTNIHNICKHDPKVISQNDFKFKDYYTTLDIKYNKIEFDKDFNVFDNFLINQNGCKPSENHIKNIQNNLLIALNKACKKVEEDNIKHNYAYMCLLSSDNYIYYVLNLYKCLLDVDSSYPLYCAVTPNLSQDTLNILKKVGLPYFVLDTKDIEESGIIQRGADLKMCQKYINALVKLDLFKNEQFDKIVYLDSDLHIFENIDELFDKPHMSAVEDLAPVVHHDNYKVGMSIFCSGLIVWDTKNNKGLAQKIIDGLKDLPNDIKWHDQNILNYWYPNWQKQPELHLDCTYGLMTEIRCLKAGPKNPKIRHYVAYKEYIPFDKKTIRVKMLLYGVFIKYFENIDKTVQYFNETCNINLKRLSLQNIKNEFFMRDPQDNYDGIDNKSWGFKHFNR